MKSNKQTKNDSLKVKLTRNLRLSVMRGHPWVYKDAVVSPRPVKQAQMCQVLDNKGELAWAIFDPHGPLCLRILSTEKSPPNEAYFQNRFMRAYQLRSSVKSDLTNSYRLFNGEGDLLPGLVCDVYGLIAVLQFDGQGPSEFWDKDLVAQWILKNTTCETVIEKKRGADGGISLVAGKVCDDEVVIKENGALFKVNLSKGQKTGFFLDQRDNRNYVRQVSSGKSVLNLFSYSGGFSIYAGLGGAKKVASADISKGAIGLAEENWKLNGLDQSKHSGLCVDVFEYLGGNTEPWDLIIVDPPSMGHAESQKSAAVNKYIEVFGAAAKRVRPQGELAVSSCSSHVSFEDFFDIINEALSKSRRRGQVLRVSGQGSDHPFPHVCHELRYLKFVHLALD